MYLINADIINSKRKSIDLNYVWRSENEFQALKQKYAIERRDFSIVAGDALRILTIDLKTVVFIAIELMVILKKYDLCSRFFISNSDKLYLDDEYTNLSEPNDEIFYQNVNLEKNLKNDRDYYRLKQFTIRSTLPIEDNLLYSLSLLCFRKPEYIEYIYLHYCEHLTQSEIAAKFKISQVAVSKKLRSANYPYFKLTMNNLQLLEEEDVNIDKFDA